MANTIQVKRSAVPAKVPTTSDLALGEIAVNTYDGKMYIKKDNGTASVVEIGSASMVYPGAGIPNSTGTSWGTSYTTTGSGTIVALQTNPTLYNPNIDVIDFDTTYATTLTAGQLGWDSTNNALAYGMAGGNIIQHIGEDQYFYIKASSAITKGQVIMFTGSVGASGVLTGAPATGITDGTYIMGVAAETIALNGFGFVQTFGVLKNVDTSAFADGDILWYDPSVTGGLTATKPSAPNVKAQVAACNKGGSAGGGIITVRINPSSQLGGTDSNVQFTSLASGQTVIYDATAGYWKNATLTAGTGISITNGAGSITVTNSSPDQTVAISGTSPVSVTGTYPNFTVSMTQSSGSVNGWLSSTDWNTFNSKAPATSGTSILYGNGSGGFSNVTVGTGLTFTGGTLASTSAPISFVYDQFTATASQTTFNTSQAYFSGKIAVYRNGALMRNGTDVTVTSGAQVVFAVALTVGDLIDVNYPPNADASKYKYDQFTATAGQTIFTTSGTYTSGKIEVFVNGAKYRNGTDCTVTSGTSVVMATGLVVGDLVDINYPVA